MYTLFTHETNTWLKCCRSLGLEKTTFQKTLGSPGRTAPLHLSIIKAAAAAAPPEAPRGLVTAHTVVSRIGRERRGIPVGSVAAVGVVRVGLVGIPAVKLPVRAVAAPAVAAAAPAVAAAGAALALTEPARDAILSSGLDIWRGVQRPFSWLEVVAEVGLRQVPVEAVQEADCNLWVCQLVSMHSVGAPQVVERVHVLGNGAVHPAGQHVSSPDHRYMFRLKKIPHPAVESGQVLHDLLAGIHRGRIRPSDVGAVLHINTGTVPIWSSFLTDSTVSQILVFRPVKLVKKGLKAVLRSRACFFRLRLRNTW